MPKVNLLWVNKVLFFWKNFLSIYSWSLVKPLLINSFIAFGLVGMIPSECWFQQMGPNCKISDPQTETPWKTQIDETDGTHMEHF